MALREPHPTFLLPLALLATCLALTLRQGWNPLNNIFQKQHMNFPKTPATNDHAYCNRMMWIQVMYWKYINTFIRASNVNINKVCTTDGASNGPYQYVSMRSFYITICTFHPWSISYTRISAVQRIVIFCRNDLPF
ncbi:ribonuclease-like [Emys orbicularis]|uniref:ribonuclease-like n=1 Tax=Emys orbicularis TaxID=82168 RepID=UPI0031FD230C